MSDVTRRRLLGGTTVLGGAATAGLLPALPAAATTATGKDPGLVRVGKPDPRYTDLVVRGMNQRFRPQPEYFHVVTSTEQVVKAVGDAVRAGKRVTVRSGGHCYENFVGDGAQVVIDMCEMNKVYFDERRGAFAVEPGATLMDAYRTLHLGWGVTLPGGQCGTVAAGGHIVGGGYGALSRKYGLTVDYLHAVEVVVVDRSGRARAVVATRDPRDPHHDLWWAHTGAGGGNFGIVTRYWLRDPKVKGNDPATLLPKPPAALLTGVAYWPWKGMTKESFRRLVRNHGEWHERNSDPGSPYASLFGVLMLNGKSDAADPGGITLACQMDATVPDAEKKMRAFFAAVAEGVKPDMTVLPIERQPWYHAVRSFALSEAEQSSHFKVKSSYLRKRFTDRQIDVAYDHLSRPASMPRTLWAISYGGQVNTVPSAATATAERDSILKVICLSSWQDGQDGAAQLQWVRELHRDLYATTGGVPVPGGNCGGAYINYPDIDHADPKWNTSGVPWTTLYYGGNYARLQRVKARWDPRDVFRHAMSIRLPKP
ncbi:FAD-binding oxidoreductase [Nonomuraea sp. NPDC052634]|uniref:FAD-binding oxidoreductase n=1 Tax=Nonomuraea sp. NPDC052634 TaxID=3155813 RepID=UPI003417B7DE